MNQFFELTDALRMGEIIRQEGRKHYRFSFGPFQWERTTMFQAYITEGTPYFGQYRIISDEQAKDLLMQRGKKISHMLKKAEQIAKKAHAYQSMQDSQPFIAHIQSIADSLPDWEEKTAAWLHDVCTYSDWSVEKLGRNGFDRKICLSVKLLTMRPDDKYSDYLSKLRQDRIARRVKIAELAFYIDAANTRTLSPDEQNRIEKYREARKYLFGDIPSYSDTTDVWHYDRPQTNPVPSMDVYQTIYPLALGGQKLPHGVSNPVLRKKGGLLYFAFFVYTYTRSQLQQGAIGRPIRWLLADINTGQLVESISCSEHDFSSAGNSELFSVQNPYAPKDPDYFKHTYAILDAVRTEYAETGTLNAVLYEEYIRKILLCVPPSYHRFYRELSCSSAEAVGSL